MWLRKVPLLLLLLLSGCGQQSAPVRVFAADSFPEHLSDWNLLRSDGRQLRLGSDVIPYDLNTPLFTDYALKLRAVYLPAGKPVTYREGQALDFPVGTVISKTFYYAVQDSSRVLKDAAAVSVDARRSLSLSDYRLLETRLLIRYDTGWRALPYVWNDAQTDASLEIAGALSQLEMADLDGSLQVFNYIIPDANQCAGCHAPNHSDKELSPIGPRVDQLNKFYNYDDGVDNQLSHWLKLGKLDRVPADLSLLPRRADWSDAAVSLERRARAYLDANCAHCHNPKGAADTSGLHLNIDARMDRNFGICKPPVAAGRGSGDRPYDIFPGRPDSSILLFRMQHSDPAIAMPELGRSLNHAEGAALIEEWIANMSGSC